MRHRGISVVLEMANVFCVWQYFVKIEVVEVYNRGLNDGVRIRSTENLLQMASYCSFGHPAVLSIFTVTTLPQKLGTLT